MLTLLGSFYICTGSVFITKVALNAYYLDVLYLPLIQSFKGRLYVRIIKAKNPFS